MFSFVTIKQNSFAYKLISIRITWRMHGFTSFVAFTMEVCFRHQPKRKSENIRKVKVSLRMVGSADIAIQDSVNSILLIITYKIYVSGQKCLLHVHLISKDSGTVQA